MPKRRALLISLVILCVVLSGCGGLNTQSTPQATVTPGSVPTDQQASVTTTEPTSTGTLTRPLLGIEIQNEQNRSYQLQMFFTKERLSSVTLHSRTGTVNHSVDKDDSMSIQLPNVRPADNISRVVPGHEPSRVLNSSISGDDVRFGRVPSEEEVSVLVVLRASNQPTRVSAVAGLQCTDERRLDGLRIDIVDEDALTVGGSCTSE